MQLLQLLVVEPHTDDAAGSSGEHQARVGTHAGEHLANQVVGLADKYSLVRVVGSQSEALVSEAPGKVSITVSRN